MNQPNQSNPWQYSIRSLLILTAVVAVACSAVFALPDWAFALLWTLVVLVVPPVLLTVLLHGNPDQKAFALGALFPSSLMYLALFVVLVNMGPSSFADFHDWSDRLAELLFLFGGGGAAGGLCVAVRRRLERTRPRRPDDPK